MGGSGAGKTTLLDIIAGKNKSGESSGSLYVNGELISTKQELYNFQQACGFVDQEDVLIPTLTVYETVLNSALLRLPRSMPIATKKAKVLQILSELRILNIKDKIIGSDYERGISGGEKRRVAIAQELVTSPSILFLDEPTSGLDGYNAFNVVESLVRLARDFNRTIIFTIHQPRSNIVALFDKLLLLSEGELIYSGRMNDTVSFFSDHGYVCPSGYNIADYLIDVTAAVSSSYKKRKHIGGPNLDIENQTEAIGDDADAHLHDELLSTNTVDDPTSEWAHYAEHRDEIAHAIGVTGEDSVQD
ncbi:unnamed protein product [Ambrosiozyma monospora]|uniref:Unnamed protein product n=1 Tax=Ambrosiozyma monospora TaxID=43982 RepID=A0ACB5UAK0_AMBMO|nr:unnamed protein product [Ambrosiozyma monospora]